VPSGSSTIRGTVEPDYFQFYARRRGAEWAADKVTREGYEAQLWTDGGFVYVATKRKFGATPLEITFHPSRVGNPDAHWQHVVEVSLGPGGPLEIFNWPGDDPALTIELPPGNMRLRVSWQGLVVGQFEGLDEDGNTEERLSFDLWPEPLEPPRVIRQWNGWPSRG
jgi:hypothetical protein